MTAVTPREVSLKNLGARVVFSCPLDVLPWQGGRENGWKCCLSKHAQLGRGKYGIEKLLDAWFEGRGGWFFPPQSGCLWSA